MKTTRITTLLLLLIGSLSAFTASAQAVLDDYIRQGLTSNVALKQPRFAYQKSLIALQEAKGLFMPTAYFDFQYTAAEGGRKIDLPLGDLLNPTYRTLNQLTGSESFPTIQNQRVQFLPNNFQTTRVVVSMPLLNSEIYYNRLIKGEQITYQQAEIRAYQRELVKQIKMAYYKFLQAGKAVNIINSSKQLVEENLRFNQKLVNNQVALRSTVSRSKAEQSKIDAQLLEAENNQKLAAYSFNFLLNQPLDTPIAADTVAQKSATAQDAGIAFADENEVGQREEILKLNSALRVNELQVRMNKAYVLPTIGHSLEGGYQGFGFKYDGNQSYYLYGVNLRWNLFQGYQNKLRINQSLLDRQALEAQKDNTAQQIQLQIQSAAYTLQTARQLLKANGEAQRNSEEFFRVINVRYREGQALLLEYLDARNQLTSAQLNYSLAQLQVLTREAELEQATASYTLN